MCVCVCVYVCVCVCVCVCLSVQTSQSSRQTDILNYSNKQRPCPIDMSIMGWNSQNIFLASDDLFSI